MVPPQEEDEFGVLEQEHVSASGKLLFVFEVALDIVVSLVVAETAVTRAE